MTLAATLDASRGVYTLSDAAVEDAFEAFFTRVLQAAEGASDLLSVRKNLRRESFEQANEVRGLVDVVASRPDLSARFPGGDAMSLDNCVVAPALARYVTLTGGLTYEMQAVRDLAEEFVRALREESTPVTLVAPLLHVESDVEGVDLGDGWELSPLTPRESRRLLDLYGGPLAPAALAIVQSRLAVRLRTSFFDFWDLSAGRDAATSVTTALRLTQATNASVAAVWAEPERLTLVWAASASTIAWDDPSPFADPATIGEGNVDEIVRVARLCRDAPNHDGRLRLALRRFNTAIDRRDREDQIIDLWIALEALLLPDARSELIFRASLRLAHALGRDHGERLELFDLCRSSYKVRSAIVHGDEPTGVREISLSLRDATRRLLWLWIDPGTRRTVEGLDREILR